MPVKLNLLPPELAVGKDLRGAIKTLRALGVIGVAAFLVFGIGVGIFFITSTISLNGINANITKLSSEVSAQQKSEQQVVLLKDRLAKIASVRKLPSALQNQNLIEPFLNNLSPTSSVKEMAINTAAIDLSVVLSTSPDLSSFISSLQSSDVFKTVTLSSFSLSPAIGYSLEINVVPK